MTGPHPSAKHFDEVVGVDLGSELNLRATLLPPDLPHGVSKGLSNAMVDVIAIPGGFCGVSNESDGNLMALLGEVMEELVNQGWSQTEGTTKTDLHRKAANAVNAQMTSPLYIPSPSSYSFSCCLLLPPSHASIASFSDASCRVYHSHTTRYFAIQCGAPLLQYSSRPYATAVPRCVPNQASSLPSGSSHSFSLLLQHIHLSLRLKLPSSIFIYISFSLSSFRP